jgi:pimeloyl-ACP methyl ester carboxylesterase
VVLLLHGFPTSSFMFRELIPRLADQYRVIAPDLPGFGFTEVPARRHYRYSFDALARTLDAFTTALNIQSYVLYAFDYGAPTGFRLAIAHPERVLAIVSQNGNAYEEGLGDAWGPIRTYWAEEARRALAVAQACRTRGWQAWALRLRGEVAAHRDPPEHAEGHYRDALVLADQLGMRPLAAHCHLGLGKLYRRTGKQRAVQEHLITATTMYREMDMRFWLEQAEAELRRP